MKGRTVGLFNDPEEPSGAAGAGPEQDATPPRGLYPAHAPAQQPVDLNDPLWAPIDGITLDKYAQLTAAMARQDPGTLDQAQAWLESQGVKPGTWGQVQTGWVNRMSTDEGVRTRYGILYAQG